ncbi:MAG: hypothetical protein J6C46_04320 [Clostridia bacterium]|nr:hypothetical protein [Clostridia bacterium]
MKKLKLIILFSTLILTLTGCFSKSEIEDLAYVIAIGIDKGSEDNILVSYQLAVPIKIAGEGSEGGKGSTTIVSLETDSLYNSISRANTMISKEITLSHNKLIVISEKLAQDGIHDLLNALVTNREVRPKTSIIVYKGQAKEMLENLEPVLEKNPARYYDLLLDANQYTGYALDNYLFNFYISSKDTLASPYALIAEPVRESESSIEIPSRSKYNPDSEPEFINSGENVEKNSDSKKSGDSSNQNNQADVKNSTGGSQNKQTTSTSQEKNNESTNDSKDTPKTANLAGIAIFKNDRLVGEIKNEQIISHLLLLGELKKVNIDIEDIEDKSKTTVVKARQREMPQIKVEIKNNIPKINILIRLECDLITSGSEIDYTDKENKDKLSTSIKEKLNRDMHVYLSKIAQDFKADAIGFGKYYRKEVLTLKELNNIKWEEVFPNSEFNVEFQLHLDTTQMVSNKVS